MDKVVLLFRNRPFFETQELKMLFDEPVPQIQVSLSRWVRQGKIIQLRRGRYLLAEEFRYQTPSIYYTSNYLYRPSYVSLHSALEFHSFIPEATGIIQAVTPRQTRKWSTPVGNFHYRSLQKERFFGYQKNSLNEKGSYSNQQSFFMAVPEKALLDLFYFAPGQWTIERIEEMRFQNLQELDFAKFEGYVKQFSSPKVERAAHHFLNLNFRGVPA